MDRAELMGLIARTKRATTNRDVLTICQEAESMLAKLAALAKAKPANIPAVSLANKPAFDKVAWMRSYMRDYRASKRRSAKGQTVNEPSPDRERTVNKP